MSQIEGINKTPQAVTQNHRGLVQAAMSDSEIDQMLAGWAFQVGEDTVTPTGANDWLAFKNISDQIAVLTRLAMTDAAAEVITASLAANYVIAGTNAVPDKAFNRSGALVALADKMQVAVGVVVSGTGTVLSEPLLMTTGAGTVYQNILADRSGPIIIPPQHCLTFSAGTGSGAITNIVADLHFIAEPFIDG